MENIEVHRTGPDTYAVTVVGGGSVSSHVVTAVEVAAVDHATTPEQLVEASFRFLLDREPKEAILSRFDLGVIARYFPEYPTAVAEYLRG